MTINSHITEFAGLPVVDVDPDRPAGVASDAVARRLRLRDSPEGGDLVDARKAGRNGARYIAVAE
ncbi:hypothetical protein ACFP2T_29030 [Plantactinospora solaniradicis]|uniref:Uncharacterized protein n=1 Tax=Plantactinospora solaniradicis TaxID=1723736 RepID=A0ABW1KEI2_9ACTN